MFINKISALVCRMLKSFHAMKQSLQFLNRLVKLEVNILETVTHDRQKECKMALEVRNKKHILDCLFQ